MISVKNMAAFEQSQLPDFLWQCIDRLERLGDAQKPLWFELEASNTTAYVKRRALLQSLERPSPSVILVSRAHDLTTIETFDKSESCDCEQIRTLKKRQGRQLMAICGASKTPWSYLTIATTFFAMKR